MFVPTELALRLDDAGSYTAALDWFRSIYDYERRVDERKVAYGLVINGDADFTFVRGADWIADPLDPHAVAATRRDSYTRYAILSIVGCLLDYADSEFTQASSESLPRARELYLKALELLDAPELEERAGACDDILGRLQIQIGSDEERQVWHQVARLLGQIRTREELLTAAGRVEKIMASDGTASHRLARAYAAAKKAAAASEPDRLDLASILERDAAARDTASVALLAEPRVAGATELIAARDGFDTITGWWSTEWVPAPSPSFCIRPNPLIEALRSHAEVNLRKLRSCRSISGLELHVAPYAEDTAATVGGGDGLPAPPANVFQPLPYRYSTLIERTKQLVELARQLEQSTLAAIQNADHALYEELKARHDMALARSQLRLHDLQLVQAADGVRAAELQRDRATISAGHYQGLIDAGLSENEQISIGFLYAAALLHAGSAAASFYGAASVEGVASSESTPIAAGLSSLAATSSTLSQISSTYASYERRAEDWRLQRDLSQQDIRIGEQQIRPRPRSGRDGRPGTGDRVAPARPVAGGPRLPDDPPGRHRRALRVDERRAGADLPLLPAAGDVDGQARGGTARLRAAGARGRVHPGRLLGGGAERERDQPNGARHARPDRLRAAPGRRDRARPVRVRPPTSGSCS